MSELLPNSVITMFLTFQNNTVSSKSGNKAWAAFFYKERRVKAGEFRHSALSILTVNLSANSIMLAAFAVFYWVLSNWRWQG